MKWHTKKPLAFTSVKIMAHELPCDWWSGGAAFAHSLVTVECDIGYSVYIAQMLYCQPPIACQVNCHYKGA